MSECMPIPDNWKDFVKEYSFKDIREIYTNGSWLIPTFRVEQMMEHFVKPDWISVKDRLPTSGDPVMVTTGNWGNKPDVCTARLWTNKDGSNPEWRDYYGEDVESLMGASVTHWMPLPQKPESE